MLIVDAHLDLSWNALGWNRDLDQTVAEIRLSEAGMDGTARGKNTVSFPEMRRGRVGIALATLLARANRHGCSSLDFRTQEIDAFLLLRDDAGEAPDLPGASGDARSRLFTASRWGRGSG